MEIIKLRYVNEDILKNARDCLTYILRPNVWHSVTLKWKMLTYGAMVKWHHVIGDQTNALYYGKILKDLALKLPCIGKNTCKNIEHLLEYIKIPSAGCKYIPL